jgi:predicted short-subunit dehydrogenase-like oxidoreductase (DUF2520 family)
MIFFAAMGKKLQITIVGPGRLGTALAVALDQAEYSIDEIVSRDRAESLRRVRTLGKKLDARGVAISEASLSAEVIWICVGDGAIREISESLAQSRHDSWKGKVVFHSSGALASDELDSLRKRGALVASVHPMMSFVHAAKPSLAGVTFALEGDAAALRTARPIVRKLKGNCIDIAKKDKALYHAWGGFSSPLIVAELATADLIARKIGIPSATARKTLAPILRQTVENYIEYGPAAAFSGPIVRGDVGTVRRHLDALKNVPQAREVYIALARAAVRELPAGRRAELRELLGIGRTEKRKNG